MMFFAARVSSQPPPTGATIFPYKDVSTFGGANPPPEVAPEDEDLLQLADNGDAEAKAELNSIPALADREKEDTQTAFGGWAPPANWRPAAALLKLRQKVNSSASSRYTKDDGMIGDRAHWEKGEASDHNPWVKDSNGIGVVTGYDISHSAEKGISAQALVESLIKAKDKRIKYIIWNRTIYNSDAVGGVPPWTPRAYNGKNPHDKHAHVSLLPNPVLYDSSDEWEIAVK